MNGLYLTLEEDGKIVWYTTGKGAPSGKWVDETAPIIEITNP